ncbi:hypothetical protein RND71_008596 [Anisodus tanguticus]|uniref:Uncharacterized protein n=1 Tax=Anisodus tanguticus TaxID=243964 RepID=A0AAE1SNP9_9SOLA|nr:hypothetical protein RND71_008596 [Anisodus tanguticus]
MDGSCIFKFRPPKPPTTTRNLRPLSVLQRQQKLLKNRSVKNQPSTVHLMSKISSNFDKPNHSKKPSSQNKPLHVPDPTISNKPSNSEVKKPVRQTISKTTFAIAVQVNLTTTQNNATPVEVTHDTDPSTGCLL